MMSRIWEKIIRKQSLENVTSDSSLRRCLSVFDLTLMGLGSMIGSGIYVMTGKVIKEQAGPGIVVSFILAACIVLMVAGCFTEFAARVHRTGSTYLYVYLSLGELPAFLVGFVTLIVSILSGATNARAWSGYLDSLFNGTISDFTRSHLKEWTIGPPVAQYPDFVAMLLMLIITSVVALGAKCTSWFNTLFALLNASILCFVIVVGFIYADISNWTSGFFPHGFAGVFSGAAVCFWAFSGFEILSCAVEEAHNPKRDIPIATVLALVIVMVLYVGTSASLTIMTPYYNIDTTAPLPSAFSAKNLYWAQIIVALGPLCGLTTTLMSSVYGFVRISYKISEDGLLFTFLSKINSRTHVPLWSVLFYGLTTAIISLFFDLSELISFTVVLILMSYCLVCAGVIILRYRPQANLIPESSSLPPSTSEIRTSIVEHADYALDNSGDENHQILRDRHNIPQQNHTDEDNDTSDKELLLKTQDNDNEVDAIGDYDESVHSGGVIIGQLKQSCLWLWPCNKLSPGQWPLVAVFIICIMTATAATVTVYHLDKLRHGTCWIIILLAISILVVVITVATLYAYHQNVKGLIIKMPCVPLVPSFSICVCLYLLVSTATIASWIGCFILLLIGMVLYFTYGIRHSKLNEKAYHCLRLHTLEDETVNLLADGPSEVKLNDDNR